MAGLYLSYGKQSVHPPVSVDAELVSSHVVLDDWTIDRQTLPKFPNHKFFINEPSFFFATDGVIVNRDELLGAYHCTRFSELVTALYQQHGESFFRCFRGSFSGVFYDKEKQLMLIFMDQTGSRLLFWHHTSEGTRISSDLFWLVAHTSAMQWDQLGLYELLTYGFMPSHHTVVDGIRRLPAGCYLRIKNHTCEQIPYHRFTNTSIRRTKEEAIQGVDKLFRQAVKRVLDVNAEYGYANIFPLSGGLDSRMVNWVANSITNHPIENFTYGFPDSREVSIARSIAESLSHKWHFISQVGSGFYDRIDTAVRHSGCQISYGGVAEAMDSFRVIPSGNLGMILTGIGGDEILSSKLNRSSHHYGYGECALTSAHYPEQDALVPKDFSSQYANRTIFYLYAGSFERHAMGSPIAFQCYSESYSPFMDTDFLEFIFSVPEKHRANYRLYDKWILRCYPEAAQWRHNSTAVPENSATIGRRMPEVYLFHRHIPLGSVTKRIAWYILKRLHIHNFYNSDLRNSYASDAEPIWQQYYETNQHYLHDFGKIADRINEQYNSEDIQEKLQALTVLAAIKAIKEAHRDKAN